MTLDTPRRSRRALLTAAAGAAAATVAGGLTRPLPVLAFGDDGSTITVGSTFLDVRTGTYLSNKSNTQTVFSATSSSELGVGAGIGLAGTSHSSYGVSGRSDSLDGVRGQSGTGVGVHGVTGSSSGVYGYSGSSETGPAADTGVFGFSDGGTTSVGLRGESTTGRGGVFKGNLAQVRLAPYGATSHPTSGQRGDLFVDRSGRLWFCKGHTTWKQLA